MYRIYVRSVRLVRPFFRVRVGRTPQTPGAFGSSSCLTPPSDVASIARLQRQFCRCLIYISKSNGGRACMYACVWGPPVPFFSYMSEGCAVSPRVGRMAVAFSCATGPVRFVQRRGRPSPINDGIHHGLYLL